MTAGLILSVGCVEVPAETARVQASSNAAGRFVVTLANPAGKAAVEQHAPVMRELKAANAVAAHLPQAAVQALQNNPNIAHIEPDAKRYLSSTAPTQAPYGLAAVQADQLSGGGTVKVCIIDSGLGAHHEALGHLTVTADEDPEVCRTRGPFTDCVGTGDPLFDDNGHGTHVAGTIAGTINGTPIGVAPDNVSLHIIKVFTADGWAYSSDLAHAAELCDAAGAKVINMSLGGSQSVKAEQNTFASLYANGVLSIAAAGNDGNSQNSYPASYDEVVSVAAVDDTNTRASFSQYNSQVEISAPGVAVLSSTPWDAAANVDVGGVLTEGLGIEFAALGTATGALADAGLCDSIGADLTGQIALCARGAISFYDKVANAEAAGAIATLIYNNEAGALLATLGEGNTSTGPALGLTEADGLALVAQAGATATVNSTYTFPADGYEAWDGTSMATPHVAGVAALVWSTQPNATAQEIRAALNSTAMDLGISGRDNEYGYGLVQAADAAASFPPACEATEAGEELTCNDGLDNDCDGDADGADLDCCVATEATELTCDDGIDNDCDGFSDSSDDDCALCKVTETNETSCGDGADNDCDGKVDGNDEDCATAPQCINDGGASVGQSCSSDADCCMDKCKGPRGRMTCK